MVNSRPLIYACDIPNSLIPQTLFYFVKYYFRPLILWPAHFYPDFAWLTSTGSDLNLDISEILVNKIHGHERKYLIKDAHNRASPGGSVEQNAPANAGERRFNQWFGGSHMP